MEKKMLLNEYILTIEDIQDDQIPDGAGKPLVGLEEMIRAKIERENHLDHAWSNIRVTTEIDRDYYGDCPEAVLTIRGDRMETDEEVEKRVKQEEKAAKREIREAKAAANKEKKLYKKLKKKYETS